MSPPPCPTRRRLSSTGATLAALAVGVLPALAHAGAAPPVHDAGPFGAPALALALLALLAVRSRAPGSRSGYDNDFELAQAAATPGGDDARRVLASRLLDRVRSTVFYLAGPDRDRDDIVQTAMVAILRAAGGFRGEAKLETWADRITARVAKAQLAKRHRRESLVGGAIDVETVGANAEPDSARRQRLQRRLAAALQRIPDKRREVVVLALVYQYALAEVAELVDAPLNTVRDRLRVGRKELRKLILADGELAAWADLTLTSRQDQEAT